MLCKKSKALSRVFLEEENERKERGNRAMRGKSTRDVISDSVRSYAADCTLKESVIMEITDCTYVYTRHTHTYTNAYMSILEKEKEGGRDSAWTHAFFQT